MKTNKYSPSSLSILLSTFLLLTSPIAAFSESCDKRLNSKRTVEKYLGGYTSVKWDQKNELLCEEITMNGNNGTDESDSGKGWRCGDKKYKLGWNSIIPYAVKDKSGWWYPIDKVTKRGTPSRGTVAEYGYTKKSCERKNTKYHEITETTFFAKLRINEDRLNPSYLPYNLKFKFISEDEYEIIEANF